MPDVTDLVREGAERLRSAGVESPRAEARLLMELATGLSREQMVMAGEHGIGPMEAQAFRTFVARRAVREPMAYIRGRAEFFGLDFETPPGVLIPRPETETLVEVARLDFPDETAPLRILDLGTGTGCLAIALLSLFPRATAVAVDRSAAALAVAARNAARNGVAGRLALCRGSWGGGLAGAFDLIVSNPPYVARGDLDRLQPEVARYEPRPALDGGPDGLAAYRALAPDLTRLLAKAGVAGLEIGRGQDADLVPMLEGEGFAVRPFRDLAGVVRCLELRRADPRG